MSEKGLVTQDHNLPISEGDLSAFKDRRKVLKDFVNSCLTEGKDGEGDYGVIQGTKQKSLYKAGAQKLRMIFGMSVDVVLVSEEINRYENYCRYVFKATVTHIKSGSVIASCEGECSSGEKKYATRKKWTKNAKGISECHEEPTPIADIQNTLRKMAQKRAIVGATIEATGASDFFTQDIDDEQDAVQSGMRTVVNEAEPAQGVPGDDSLGDFVPNIGKFKGVRLKDIKPDDLHGYVQFIRSKFQNIDGDMKLAIESMEKYMGAA